MTGDFNGNAIDPLKSATVTRIVEQHQPPRCEKPVYVLKVPARGIVGVRAVDVGKCDRAAERGCAAEDIFPFGALRPRAKELF